MFGRDVGMDNAGDGLNLLGKLLVGSLRISLGLCGLRLCSGESLEWGHAV
jgi:hypothetical protein